MWFPKLRQGFSLSTKSSSASPNTSPMSGITIKTASHKAKKFPHHEKDEGNGPATKDEFFRYHPAYHDSIKRILGTSYTPDSTVHYSKNGFVKTVIEAYNHHFDLVIRPDDVWIAILSQLSFYINANAESFRNHFVAHEGKKELTLNIPPSRLEDIDWDKVGDGMVDLMHENLVDKGLKEWIMPKFTTTTRVDSTVSAILMMASMKQYFDFTCQMLCGIPHVTLQGTKQDWLSLLARLDKLDTWDDTTIEWHKMLRPILKKFVAAFDGQTDRDFWGHVVSARHYGSGSTTIGGWITAFCAFSEKGDFRRGKDHFPDDGWGKMEIYKLEGIAYPTIESSEIPSGHADVNVKIVDNVGVEFEATLIAGNMALKVQKSSVEGGDAVQNVPVWACYLRDKEKEKEKEEERKRLVELRRQYLKRAGAHDG